MDNKTAKQTARREAIQSYLKSQNRSVSAAKRLHAEVRMAAIRRTNKSIHDQACELQKKTGAKQKHAQGPWTHHIGLDYTTFFDANGVEIFSVPFVMGEANARLIADAPDLLKALKNLLEYATSYSDAMADTYGYGAAQLGRLADSVSVSGMARAAIAKAAKGG